MQVELRCCSYPGLSPDSGGAANKMSTATQMMVLQLEVFANAQYMALQVLRGFAGFS